MVTSFLIQQNPPIATTTHLKPPLFTTIFIDSKTATLYTCSATKTEEIINKAMTTLHVNSPRNTHSVWELMDLVTMMSRK